jgi:hypothetical protein
LKPLTFGVVAGSGLLTRCTDAAQILYTRASCLRHLAVNRRVQRGTADSDVIRSGRVPKVKPGRGPVAF